MAEAAGHPGPHRMQCLLSRARVDEQQMLDVAAGWAAGHLSAGQDEDASDAVLIVGRDRRREVLRRGRGGVPVQRHRGRDRLCQVAVTLTKAAREGTP